MSGLSFTFDRFRVESLQLAKSKRFRFYIVLFTVKMSEHCFFIISTFTAGFHRTIFHQIHTSMTGGFSIACHQLSSNTKSILIWSFSLCALKCRSPDVSACAFSPALASAASPASRSCVLPSGSGACCVCKPSSWAPSPESCLVSYTPPHPVSAGDVKELQSDPISTGHDFISIAEQ